MRVGGQRHAPASLPPGKTRYPLRRWLGGTQGRSGRVRKMSTLPEFDPRTVQARSESLYLLRHPDQAAPHTCGQWQFCVLHVQPRRVQRNWLFQSVAFITEQGKEYYRASQPNHCETKNGVPSQNISYPYFCGGGIYSNARGQEQCYLHTRPREPTSCRW